VVTMDWIYIPWRIFNGDHQTFFAGKVWQVFRHKVGYLRLLCQQRAGHHTCEYKNCFCELHRSSFRVMTHSTRRVFAQWFPLRRSAARVLVRQSANLPVRGPLAGHVTGTDNRPGGRSPRGSATCDDPCSSPSTSEQRHAQYQSQLLYSWLLLL